MPQSVILIPVPTADPIIGKLRKKYDRAALHGIPSHITLLFPFKNQSEITKETLKKLNTIFLNTKQFSFILEKIDIFPGVVYLKPHPREKFVELTEKIVQIFPENLPYEGKFPKINPHATIAQIDISETNSLRDKIAYEIENKLPICAKAQEAWLMIEDVMNDWHIHSKFKFAL